MTHKVDQMFSKNFQNIILKKIYYFKNIFYLYSTDKKTIKNYFDIFSFCFSYFLVILKTHIKFLKID